MFIIYSNWFKSQKTEDQTNTFWKIMQFSVNRGNYIKFIKIRHSFGTMTAEHTSCRSLSHCFTLWFSDEGDRGCVIYKYSFVIDQIKPIISLIMNHFLMIVWFFFVWRRAAERWGFRLQLYRFRNGLIVRFMDWIQNC